MDKIITIDGREAVSYTHLESLEKSNAAKKWWGES